MKFVLQTALVSLAMISLGGGLYYGADLLLRSPIPIITGDKIAYQKLAKEATDPFLRSGKKPINNGYRQNNFYLKAIKDRPSARSCLQKPERNSKDPDLRKIDWVAMQSEHEIRVCLFRIFQSLGTPEKVVKWYESTGFQSVKTETYEGGGQQITRVVAANPVRRNGFVFHPATGFASRIAMRGKWSETSQAVWDEQMNLFSTSFDTTVH